MNPRDLLPRDKMDLTRAKVLVQLGYPAVAPILPELLVWLQDYNWPVAHVLAPFLASIGKPLLPHIRRVLATDDDIWKYWVLSRLVEDNFELARDLAPELSRMAAAPTPGEAEEELDQKAREILTGLRG